MKFVEHSNLSGCHAPFSASKSHWLRYSDDKAVEYLENLEAKEVGTRIHEWACETIKLGIKQSRSKKTLNSYVNDAIGFGMSPEVVLFYSEYFFGTADAISFDGKVLRIHDLKTGKSGTIEKHIEQLYIYAALFCLEYQFKPEDITIILRVYKSDDILEEIPEAMTIRDVMNTIIHLDTFVRKHYMKGV